MIGDRSVGEVIFTPTLPPHMLLIAGKQQRTRTGYMSDHSPGFAGLPRVLTNMYE